MIKIKDLCFTRNGRCIFSGLNLELESQATCLISGPSGCGKTTLLRLIAGLETPDSGTIHCNSELLSSPDFVRRPEQRNLDMMFQDDCLWPGLRIEEQLELVRSRRQNSENQSIFANKDFFNLIIESLGLKSLLPRMPESLSGGEARRCQLARVLVNAPKIILLDEPGAFLDEENSSELAELLAKILPELKSCCIIVSHDEMKFKQITAAKYQFKNLLTKLRE